MTESEMMEELGKLWERVQTGPEDAFTTQELCDSLGMTDKAVRQRLRLADRFGRLERVRVYRENLRGIRHPTVAYRIKVD